MISDEYSRIEVECDAELGGQYMNAISVLSDLPVINLVHIGYFGGKHRIASDCDLPENRVFLGQYKADNAVINLWGDEGSDYKPLPAEAYRLCRNFAERWKLGKPS